MSTIDWPTIRAKYESGISQHSLAREYGISQPAISARAKREGWVIIPHINVINDNPPDNIDNTNPATIADLALADLAKYLNKDDIANVKLELKEHKLFADSFSQYIRAKLLLPDEKPTASGIDADILPYLDLDQLNRISELHAEIDSILELARNKKLESETNIRPIRRQA